MLAGFCQDLAENKILQNNLCKAVFSNLTPVSTTRTILSMAWFELGRLSAHTVFQTDQL